MRMGGMKRGFGHGEHGHCDETFDKCKCGEGDNVGDGDA